MLISIELGFDPFFVAVPVLLILGVYLHDARHVEVASVEQEADTVGGTVWFRFATVGPGGVLGPWSDPAKLVVT